METNAKNRIIIGLIFLSLGILAFASSFSFFGKDGFYVWLPALADYGRGLYETGGNILGGQNLTSIYGKLPHWAFLKLFSADALGLSNSTLVVFLLLAYHLSVTIFRGLTGRDDLVIRLLILIYVSLSPIVTNRVYSGHFNLLFGLLPLLVSLSLIYDRSWKNILIGFLALWSAFSIQSYQILAYYIFYLPVLMIWIRSTPGLDVKRYSVCVCGVTIAAFVINLDVFLQLLEQATNPDNLRNNKGNIVYSHAQFSFIFSGNLLSSGFDVLTKSVPWSYFHEFNYPIGLSFLAVLRRKHRSVLVALLGTFVFLLLFAANLPGFNFFSELVPISLFRVPQRSLMLAGFLIPLVALASYKEFISYGFLMALLLMTLLANLAPIEVYLGLGLGMIFLSKKYDLCRFASVAFALSLLFNGIGVRIQEIRSGNQLFSLYENFVRQLDQTHKLSGTKKIIHFESDERIGLTFAANYLNIKTAEGYGHPDKKSWQAIKDLQPEVLPEHGNRLFFYDDGKNFKTLLRHFRITDVFYVHESGNYKHVLTKNL